MPCRSEQNRRYLPAALSLVFHAVLAVVFIFIRFERPARDTGLVELFLYESPADTPAVPQAPAGSRRPERQAVELAERRAVVTPAAPDVAAPEPSPSATVDLPAVRQPDRPAEPILKRPPHPRRFTPYADGDMSRPYADSSGMSPFERGETLFEGTPYALRPSSQVETEPAPVPPEEARDERRTFRDEMLGVRMTGPLMLIPGAIHAAKSLVRGFRDREHRNRIEEMRRNHLAGITERDVRFLILMWRDGLLDPAALSRRDRLFLGGSPPAEPETNAASLGSMYDRGLADVLQVGGRIVFRATFSKAEVIPALCQGEFGDDRSPASDERLRFVELIQSCFDPVTGTVAVPDSLVTGR